MNFITNHFSKIVLGLLVAIFVQQCSNSRRVSNLEKQARLANSRLDSLVTRDELLTRLEAEGLRAEKRMIQSTDRTMLDVNRQSEIDAQLKKLEK